MDRHWAAVIGDPVAHSLSPRIFKSWAAATGKRLEYRAVRIEPAGLSEALAAARKEPWVGWNVTLPHKVAIMKEIDNSDSSVIAVGAVNVVRFTDAECRGFNTDAAGFFAPLARMGFALKGRKVVILGAGGAARAVCWAISRSSLRSCVIMNRDAAKAAHLAAAFGMLPAVSNDANLAAAISQADLVVNATPLGMDGKSSPIPLGLHWKKGALAYDLVYRPLETPFLRQAAEAGAATLGGLPMLVAQAAATWQIWFRETLPAAAVAAAEADLKGVLE